MRDVREGDVVLHLTDNDAFTGASIVASAADASFPGISGTAWGDRPCYRVQLRAFEKIDPPLDRDWHTDSDLPKLAPILDRERADGPEMPDLANPSSPHRSQNAPQLMGQGAIKLPRLQAAVRLFRWMYGQEGFASQRYLTEERNYKLALSDDWRKLATRERIEEALSHGLGSVELAASLADLLTDQKRSICLRGVTGWLSKALETPERAQLFSQSLAGAPLRGRSCGPVR